MPDMTDSNQNLSRTLSRRVTAGIRGLLKGKTTGLQLADCDPLEDSSPTKGRPHTPTCTTDSNQPSSVRGRFIGSIRAARRSIFQIEGFDLSRNGSDVDTVVKDAQDSPRKSEVFRDFVNTTIGRNAGKKRQPDVAIGHSSPITVPTPGRAPIVHVDLPDQTLRDLITAENEEFQLVGSPGSLEKVSFLPLSPEPQTTHHGKPPFSRQVTDISNLTLSPPKGNTGRVPTPMPGTTLPLEDPLDNFLEDRKKRHSTNERRHPVESGYSADDSCTEESSVLKRSPRKSRTAAVPQLLSKSTMDFTGSFQYQPNSDSDSDGPEWLLFRRTNGKVYVPAGMLKYRSRNHQDVSPRPSSIRKSKRDAGKCPIVNAADTQDKNDDKCTRSRAPQSNISILEVVKSDGNSSKSDSGVGLLTDGPASDEAISDADAEEVGGLTLPRAQNTTENIPFLFNTGVTTTTESNPGNGSSAANDILRTTLISPSHTPTGEVDGSDTVFSTQRTPQNAPFSIKESNSDEPTPNELPGSREPLEDPSGTPTENPFRALKQGVRAVSHTFNAPSGLKELPGPPRAYRKPSEYKTMRLSSR